MPRKISQLEAATDVTASDLIQIIDIEDTGMAVSGTNKRATAQLMANELGKLTNITATGSTAARSLANRFSDVVNVKDFGAVGDGVTDDSVAIQNAVNTNKVVYFPTGNYKTNTQINNIKWTFGNGASFSGTNPIDIYPTFGTGAFKVICKNYSNGIIGIAHNELPSSTLAFPTGVTGYGRNENDGNTAFGIYAEARQYADQGVVTNEIDSFNFGSAPSSALPPNRAIGTTQQHPIALTVAAGGTADSSIGIHIVGEGSSSQQFLTGVYLHPDACVNYGIFIDATSSSTYQSAVIKHSVSRTGINVIGVGTPVVNNAWLTYSDGTNTSRFSVRQDGRIGLDSAAILQTTVGASGAASALPANPLGYFKIVIDGTTRVVPYYTA